MNPIICAIEHVAFDSFQSVTCSLYTYLRHIRFVLSRSVDRARNYWLQLYSDCNTTYGNMILVRKNCMTSRLSDRSWMGSSSTSVFCMSLKEKQKRALTSTKFSICSLTIFISRIQFLIHRSKQELFNLPIWAFLLEFLNKKFPNHQERPQKFNNSSTKVGWQYCVLVIAPLSPRYPYFGMRLF